MPNKRVRKAVVPVAGLGTRVLPGTKVVPKELLNVVDRPILSYVVAEARAAGIEHFVFVKGKRSWELRKHVPELHPRFPDAEEQVVI